MSTQEQPVMPNPEDEIWSMYGPALTGKNIKMYSDLEHVAKAAAELFAETAAQAQRNRGVFRVALSGGSTPRRFHELLAGAPYRERVNWGQVEFYWGDERTVAPDDAESNYHMAYETLLRSLLDDGLIRPEQIHRMQGELSDHEAAARAYEDALRTGFGLAQGELPRFDLIYLGMGPDGHTLSLFPGTAALHVMDRLVVANDVPQQHTTRITLTVPAANHAALIAFLIAGADKADALQEVLQGAYNPDRYPSQLIKPTDGELRFLVDRAAVGQA